MYPPIPLHFGRYASVEKTIMGKVRFHSFVFKFFKVEFSQQVTLGSKVLDQNILEHRIQRELFLVFLVVF